MRKSAVFSLSVSVCACTCLRCACAEQLLYAIGAATDPGANPVDRAEWAADGKTARTTLSEIVRMRNTTGQPSLNGPLAPL